MASMEEKIQIKRQRTETFIASLPGQSKKVRVVTFTQAQLPKAHVTETGGLLGMVLFNDGQATFQQDNTSFVRALLMNSNYPNIYNYSSVNQYPQVPHWQNGAALPVYGDCTVDSITARIKSVAEDKGQAGLRMASLEFDIVPSKEDLIIRDATAAHICRSNGIDVPPAIAQAYQNQLLENPTSRRRHPQGPAARQLARLGARHPTPGPHPRGCKQSSWRASRFSAASSTQCKRAIYGSRRTSKISARRCESDSGRLALAIALTLTRTAILWKHARPRRLRVKSFHSCDKWRSIKLLRSLDPSRSCSVFCPWCKKTH